MLARRPDRLPSRKTVVFFAAVAAVSVTALIWMGVRLLAQDRALEAQRLKERQEAAADRVVAALDQLLLADERRLATLGTADLPDPAEADNLLVLAAGPSGIRLIPEKAALFHPEPPAAHDAPAALFVPAERLEFVERDHERAIAALRPLTGSRDASVRAGAALRLARNLRKAGRPAEALEVYGELSRATETVSGLPAGIVGRSGRCLLLEELTRREQLRQEAGELRDGLAAGRWTLDRDAYLHYAAQAARWLGEAPAAADARLALSEGAWWLWHTLRAERQVQPQALGRRSLRFHGVPVTILWRASGDEVTALVAGPRYQERRWFAPVFTASDFSGVRIGVADHGSGLIYGASPSAGLPSTLRPAAATSLPWDVSVTSADRDSSSFGERRRVMIFGLALVVLFVVASSYFAGRAVSRELAAARLQSDFVSAVSHEFRTPLTSMKQFTEMLVEDDELPEQERRECYAAQERATRRLSRLVESLLDFGRMEAGARPYRHERLDAAELVRAVVEEFRLDGRCNGFAIDYAVPDGEVPIDGDREALAQALWNLLDNAVKYSGESRSIRVDLEGGDPVAIRVHDNGLGVTPAERHRIFEKFARGSSAGRAGIKGTGIGLAMVRHIADAHGGTIGVDGRAGGGTTFTIGLPRGRVNRCRES